MLLAYGMNGAPRAAEHGFPLRAVVPGDIGARSVKWLTRVAILRQPSTSLFQRSDYTLDGTALGEVALSAAACRARAGGATLRAEGYAIGAGGRRVDRVDVSSDGGRTSRTATLTGNGEPWTWRLWRAHARLLPGCDELIVRAGDTSGRAQPQHVASVWNPRGYMNNAWHRVPVRSRPREPVLGSPLLARAR